MNLPIDAVLPKVAEALAAGSLVLQAPPGAGKTTGVPLALLDAPWRGDGRIVMLEPRRLAARAAARRMADLLGEAVGETVGYRVRLDSKVSPRTRIEVVTDGLFTRRIQADPGLEGVAAVLFDEVHERSLQVDLGLALALETRALRGDLRLVAMSATLDAAPLADLLAAPVVTSEGRAFPVAVRHRPRPDPRRLAPAVAEAVAEALADSSGDVLVFLPGVAEIRRAAAALATGPKVDVRPLYGDLSAADQDAAIRPAPPGRRKVVLATAIAETSLTIEGVTAVVDSGLARVSRFDPRSGMDRLVTERVSRAGAEQRRGRAGRLAPGLCLRLWPAGEHGALAEQPTPEIRTADLAPLALDLAHWGAQADQLAWLDPPPDGALAQAHDLLHRLHALDAEGRITDHGRAMAGLGCHPRLAHMMLAAPRGLGGLACTVAALLEERDVLTGAGRRDADLRPRLAALARPDDRTDRAAVQRIRQTAKRWRQRLKPPGDGRPEDAGTVLALAYPDRLALRRGQAPRYRLSGGRGAALPDDDPLAAEPGLVIADLDGAGADARIRLAAPLARAEMESLFADDITEAVEVAFASDAVTAWHRRRLGALVLDERRAEVPPEKIPAALLDALRRQGLDLLPWTDTTRAWRQRVAWLHASDPAWPAMDDASLLATLDTWLAPFLAGLPPRQPFAALDLAAALAHRLPPELAPRLDRAAPTHLTLASGRRVAVDYGGEEPVLAVRLQEMFGTTETPTLAGRPVLLHLLSPAGRPVQITRDLAGFWADSYKAVRADMRGRYPKHPWPEDPANAEPGRPRSRR